VEWIGKVVQDIFSCNAKNTLISVMKKIVTFGEIMMRLTTPGFRRFEQAENFSAVFGGGEANVSAALAYMGLPSAHVTCFPDHDLGRAAAAFFQKAGVDMAHTIFRGERLGLYFMETGAAMRASKIIYDRFGSAFAKLEPEWFSWASIFEQAQWFHWTGITPAISATAAEACLQAAKTARQLGLTVSADVNNMAKLPLKSCPISSRNAISWSVRKATPQIFSASKRAILPPWRPL
jgi:2-dehydro-3-deoxygluconokinase